MWGMEGTLVNLGISSSKTMAQTTNSNLLCFDCSIIGQDKVDKSINFGIISMLTSLLSGT